MSQLILFAILQVKLQSESSVHARSWASEQLLFIQNRT